LTEPIVELHGVSKRYGEHVALENFSLEVRRGEFLTLLGPSGSGKTTIMRLVAAFEEPQAGQIFIEGQDAANLPPERQHGLPAFRAVSAPQRLPERRFRTRAEEAAAR
jgi:ABC-type Fe3+/spermidine/putrescine transport system ATPase subunit